MAQMNMIEAIRSAHDVMMERDETVVVVVVPEVGERLLLPNEPRGRAVGEPLTDLGKRETDLAQLLQPRRRFLLAQRRRGQGPSQPRP